MQDQARIAYRQECLEYAIVAPYLKKGKKPPRLPAILRSMTHGDS